jgi:lipid-binding SYLF domain-containing protein
MIRKEFVMNLVVRTGPAARAAGALAIVINMAGEAAAQAPGRRQDADAIRVNNASTVVTAVSAADKGIPRAVLDKAEAIIVFPQLARVTERAGTGPNTRRTARMLRVDGRGVFSVRGDGGAWSSPAFINVVSENVPDRADLVLVVVNRRALEGLMRPDVPIGEGNSIAAGPTAGDQQAWTDAQRRADILGYTRLGGTLQGVAITTGRLQSDTIANQRYYGKTLTTPAAVAQTEGPPSVAPWRELLQKQLPRR